MANLQERFWSKVNKTETCWLWIGALTSDGYGYFWEGKGKSNRAHRTSLIIHGTEIPAGMVVDHKCRVRNCVNPNHLRVVTARQNSIENSIGATAKHHATMCCPKGHPLSGDNLEPWELKRGRRKCLICHLASRRRWYGRQKAAMSTSATK